MPDTLVDITPVGTYPAAALRTRTPIFKVKLAKLTKLAWLTCLAFSCTVALSQDIPVQPADGQNGDAVLQLLLQKGLVTPAQAAVPTHATQATQTTPYPVVQQIRDRASEMVMSAMHFLGVSYRLGGNSEEEGFDCSGFTRHVFENSIGLVLPRRADEQARSSALRQIKREELKPGDLVFFNTMRRTFSHVGIYVGEGRFIHAPRTGAKVRLEDMRMAYWSKRFDGARRIAAPAAQGADTATR